MTTQKRDSEETPALHLHELIKGFRSAMLVTHEGGDLRARPMSIADVGADSDIWFSTSVQSPKIEAMRSNSRVLVTMQEGSRFVSVGGPCVLSQDRAQIARLWSDSWKIWFPKGKEDPEIVLVKVHIESGEFWDLHGKEGVRFLWEAAKAYFRGEKAKTTPDAHGTV